MNWIKSKKHIGLGGNRLKKYQCSVCGYVYDPALGDPDSGIAPGTSFADIPDDWVCPAAALPRINLNQLKTRL